MIDDEWVDTPPIFRSCVLIDRLLDRCHSAGVCLLFPQSFTEIQTAKSIEEITRRTRRVPLIRIRAVGSEGRSGGTNEREGR